MIGLIGGTRGQQCLAFFQQDCSHTEEGQSITPKGSLQLILSASFKFSLAIA